ncbi:hypothetical protein [Natrinema halophilum]|uniref:Uncharacterized protein n=1 Tax=Natrinema halophilum TaxID=1699371 RepID=A0A7D5GNR0_9EURY|nr:hypothetical protein [Natrinema halophilum]QLG49593.1 hypothetical protein HYG82_12350 [Natrinema halophilum]
MNRTTSITLVAVLVVTAVAVPLAAAGVVSNDVSQADTDPKAGNESVKPGERFVAAVGVQNAEIEGDVSERAYRVRIANAETNETKAAIVAAQIEETETRLDELEARLETLNESRAAGERSEGRYRAEVAKTVAELRTVERQVTAAETTAARLPKSVLAERGVDVESIRTLRDRAGELGGPDTTAIARSVAGDEVGRSMGDDRATRRPNAGDDSSADETRVDGGNGTIRSPNEN